MLSFLYYTFVVLYVTVLVILSFLVLVVTVPFDKSRKCVHEISRLICSIFFGCIPLSKRTIDGVENIDKKKAYVMVMNHCSQIDILAAYKIPLNFRWVSKVEVFRTPFVGQLLWIHGDIPIQRGNASESMAKVLTQGKMWLKRGASVAIFPEGTRSKDAEIHRFKMGAFSLAKEAEVEILPVVMTGTHTTLKGAFVNWRNRIAIRVLPPVSVEEVKNTEIKDMAQKVQAQMVEALAQLRSEVAQQK